MPYEASGPFTTSWREVESKTGAAKPDSNLGEQNLRMKVLPTRKRSLEKPLAQVHSSVRPAWNSGPYAKAFSRSEQQQFFVNCCQEV